MSRATDATYATLVVGPGYIQGAIALARSLQVTGSRYPLFAMATCDVQEQEKLEAEGCRIIEVKQLPQPATLWARWWWRLSTNYPQQSPLRCYYMAHCSF